MVWSQEHRASRFDSLVRLDFGVLEGLEGLRQSWKQKSKGIKDKLFGKCRIKVMGLLNNFALTSKLCLVCFGGWCKAL